MPQRIIVQTEKEHNEGVRRWFLFIISIVIPFTLIYFGYNFGISEMFWLGIIWVGIVIVILYFKYIRKWIRKKTKKYGWEKINRLPDWAFKKMRGRGKNKVNGEHYIYLRKGKRYYRRPK